MANKLSLLIYNKNQTRKGPEAPFYLSRIEGIVSWLVENNTTFKKNARFLKVECCLKVHNTHFKMEHHFSIIGNTKKNTHACQLQSYVHKRHSPRPWEPSERRCPGRNTYWTPTFVPLTHRVATLQANHVVRLRSNCWILDEDWNGK